MAARTALRAGGFFRRLQARPWSFDFFHAMRWIEALHPGKPRLGRAARPLDEPVRMAQEPSLGFPISTISAMEPGKSGRPPRLEVRFFGLLGPNGPLPLHLTEFARERLLHDRDRTFPRFLDILHHRFVLLFYRAWAQAQPAVDLDRPAEDRFGLFAGALLGLGTPGLRQRDAMGDYAKLHFSGLLARQVRNRDGLEQILSAFFRVRVSVEEYVGHWMKLPVSERLRLGQLGGTLGRDAVVGSSVWDRQHKVRVHVGPLTREQYEAFLPGTRAAEDLVSWMRFYLGPEFDWDVRLVLKRDQVPRAQLTRRGAESGRPETAPIRLGWVSWLGRRSRPDDAADLTLQLDEWKAAAHA